MCSRSLRRLAAARSIEDTPPREYCTEYPAPFIIIITTEEGFFVGRHNSAQAREAFDNVSDGGLRDGFLIPDNVGNKFARAKSVSSWSLQTRSLLMNWRSEVAANREGRAAPKMTGGELSPNARTREGQRDLSASGHCCNFIY